MQEFTTVHRRMAMWDILESKGFSTESIVHAIREAEICEWSAERIAYWLQETKDSENVKAILNA